VGNPGVGTVERSSAACTWIQSLAAELLRLETIMTRRVVETNRDLSRRSIVREGTIVTVGNDGKDRVGPLRSPGRMQGSRKKQIN